MLQLGCDVRMAVLSPKGMLHACRRLNVFLADGVSTGKSGGEFSLIRCQPKKWRGVRDGLTDGPAAREQMGRLEWHKWEL